MKISGKMKRQLRKSIKNNEITGSLDRYRQTWTFNIGDMVEYDGEHALVVNEDSRGYFLLMNHMGQNWRRGSKIRPIIKDFKHAKD